MIAPPHIIERLECRVGQADGCESFKVYGDNGSGQIDYNNAIDTIDYVGPRFYSFESTALNAGRYKFCIRAVSSGGMESDISGRVEIQVGDSSPQGVSALYSEAV